MKLLQRIGEKINSLAAGRNGPDELGLVIFLAGLLLQTLAALNRIPFLLLLSTAAYGLMLFRMLSRDRWKRHRENLWLTSRLYNWKVRSSQALNRLKNRKQFRYFRCPGCRAMLRLPRGIGKKTVTCPHCKKAFEKKA